MMRGLECRRALESAGVEFIDENGGGPGVRLTASERSMPTGNKLAVRRALEAAGVELIDENGGGPGVRLKTRRAARKWISRPTSV